VWQGNGQKIMRLSLLVVNVIAIHEKRQMTAKMAGNQTGTAFVLYIITARHENSMKGEELWRESRVVLQLRIFICPIGGQIRVFGGHESGAVLNLYYFYVCWHCSEIVLKKAEQSSPFWYKKKIRNSKSDCVVGAW
jgi:hypothetical protein